MSLIESNVKLHSPKRISPWRKVAIGTWKMVGDPSVYGILEVEMDKVLERIEALRVQTGHHITITHFIGKALAETLKQNPDINCVLRFGKIYPRTSIDIFFQVATDFEGRDLTGIAIREVDKKTVMMLAEEIEAKVHAIRTHQDHTYRKMKKLIAGLPNFLSYWIIRFSGFFLYSLNLWTPWMGMPKDSFGSAMVTNYGSLGKLDMAFAPLIPYSRVPLLLALSSIQEQPVVRKGQIVIAKVMKICATFDHRLIDGVHASKMAKIFSEFCEDPSLLKWSEGDVVSG
ncbi:MAG: 2-oxo acid dehydrogenase subunit E2 [Gammaproteobacteria bacterium]|nr:2-oxo acid dehydrogenase subunit E2 [Gammaproteobacteria bacterium]